MLVELNGSDRLLGVDGCHGGDDDSFDVFGLQHGLVVVEYFDAVGREVFLGPVAAFGVRVTDADEVGEGSLA